MVEIYYRGPRAYIHSFVFVGRKKSIFCDSFIRPRWIGWWVNRIDGICEPFFLAWRFLCSIKICVHMCCKRDGRWVQKKIGQIFCSKKEKKMRDFYNNISECVPVFQCAWWPSILLGLRSKFKNQRRWMNEWMNSGIWRILTTARTLPRGLLDCELVALPFSMQAFGAS